MTAHHRAVDRVRSLEALQRQDTSWHLDEADSTSSEATFDLSASRVDAQTIIDALTSLPAAQRRALELAYLAGYTYADAARLMEAPLGTTKTKIRAALRSLRTQLHETAVVLA